MRISDWISDVCSSDLQGARSRFEPEPVERRALKLRLDPRAKIVGNGEIAVFQRPREPAFQLALGLRGFECSAIDADPRTASRRLAMHVGRDTAVGPERKAHEPFGRRNLAGDDAAPLGHMLAAPSSAVW